MQLRLVFAAVSCLCLVPMTASATIMTDFNTTDGFTTGTFSPTVVPDPADPAFTAIFSGGQQQQMFDGPSYVNGPAGYLFVNGNFTGASGRSISGDGVNDDRGLIDFTGPGAGTVSFFGANRANGGQVAVNVFGLDDTTLLGSVLITQTALNTGTPTQTILTEAAFGDAIGSIEFDLPGPAAAAPYVAAIDVFSATASTTAVPEPGSALGLCVLGACCMFRRRRK